MSATPSDWLSKAEADFGSANWELQAPTPNFDAIVFHSQQCIEKMLKGLLLKANVVFQRTHELNILAHQVKQVHASWTWDPMELAVLQPGAVLFRYPDYVASAADARKALDACTRLRASLLPLF